MASWLLHLETQYKSLYHTTLLPIHRIPPYPPPPLPLDPVNCLGLQGITKFIRGRAIIHES